MALGAEVGTEVVVRLILAAKPKRVARHPAAEAAPCRAAPAAGSIERTRAKKPVRAASTQAGGGWGGEWAVQASEASSQVAFWTVCTADSAKVPCL